MSQWSRSGLRGAELKRTRNSWYAMKERCFNPRNNRYHLYGGRGITVCERWLTFDNFAADMGVRPEGTSIDRLDGNGNYEPGNCRWATPTEQNRNLRPRRVSIWPASLRDPAQAAALAADPHAYAETITTRQQWTLEEIREACRTDLTAAQIGQKLGRSAQAVSHIRHKAKRSGLLDDLSGAA